MFDVEELVKKFCDSIRIRESSSGEYTFVTPHFFHIESDESIALRFSQTEDGRPVVTDCGTTRDYLELMYINLSDYKEKLQKIKERFFIEEDDGAFVMTIPTTSYLQVLNHVGYFIQGITMIANIDL